MWPWERNCRGGTRRGSRDNTTREAIFFASCQSHVKLTFGLREGSDDDGSCTDVMTAPGPGGQLGAQGQPGKHGAETEALQCSRDGRGSEPGYGLSGLTE